MAEKIENEVPVQQPDNTKVDAGVEAMEAAKEQAGNAQLDKDWGDRIEIFKEKNGREPDPDTELKGLDNIISDDEVKEWREKHSPRSLFYERIRTNMPEGKYDEDEQEYFRHAGEMLDKAETGSKKYEEITNKLMRRYQEDPEEVAILLDYMEGTPLIEAIVKHKGEEALTMKEGMEGWDGYQKAVADRKADREKYVNLMNEIDGNMKSSQTEFDAWAEEQGLDEKQKDAVWQLIQSDLNNLSRGKIGKDILNRYRSAMDHDRDVDGAYEQGRADGKNAQIEAKRKEMKGSGLPNGNGGGAAKEKEEKELDAREQFAMRMRNWRKG